MFMIIIFLMWSLVFGLPTWLTKSIKVALITIVICTIVSVIIYPYHDHDNDPVVKDTWADTAPLTLSYEIAGTEPGATFVKFSITNPTNLQYQDVKISCAYDYLGDDENWHHQDSSYISTGTYVVEPLSTYSSANFDETGRDLLITEEQIKNLSCNIMHGFLSSPSSFTVP